MNHVKALSMVPRYKRLLKMTAQKGRQIRLEARVGVEPTNSGFADHRLGPLGYRAPVLLCPKSMPKSMPNAPYSHLFTPNGVPLNY
jgi:hypothetical protein